MTSLSYDITYFLIQALNIYSYLIILRVIISWIPVDPSAWLIQILLRVTEVVLAPLRRVIPVVYGIDFSTVVALLGIYFIKYMLWRSLA